MARGVRRSTIPRRPTLPGLHVSMLSVPCVSHTSDHFAFLRALPWGVGPLDCIGRGTSLFLGLIHPGGLRAPVHREDDKAWGSEVAFHDSSLRMRVRLVAQANCLGSLWNRCKRLAAGFVAGNGKILGGLSLIRSYHNIRGTLPGRESWDGN
jgi:hypothetical protein